MQYLAECALLDMTGLAGVAVSDIWDTHRITVDWDCRGSTFPAYASLFIILLDTICYLNTFNMPLWNRNRIKNKWQFITIGW